MSQHIPLDKVFRNEQQPRTIFDERALRELAASIRERGLMQAITVRPRGDGFQIIGGERRYRAHCLLRDEGAPGFDAIMCEVVDIDDNEMALQAIVENLARKDLKPLEEARAFQRMLDRGWTVEQLAKDLGISQPRRITDRVNLLNLDDGIQKLVDADQFPIGYAHYLVDLPESDQLQIVKLYSAGKLKDLNGIRAAAQLVRDRLDQSGMFDSSPTPSKDDVAAMLRLEKLVGRITGAIASGFKDGEFVAVKTVDPHKADKLADTIAIAARTLRSMEAQLREAQARMMLM